MRWCGRLLWRIERSRRSRQRFAAVVVAGLVALFIVFRSKDPSTTQFTRLSKMQINQHKLLFKELKTKENIQRSTETSLYNERQEQARSVCESHNTSSSSFSMATFVSSSWFAEEYKLLYCLVPKVGCTFWKRTLQVLRRHARGLKTPYKLLYEECSSGRVGAIQNIMEAIAKGHNLTDIISQRYTKFMFTRDPFQRLFSAYIDKFLTPNMSFWNIGKVIVEDIRGVPQKNGWYGHDVSFSEFIDYVLTTEDKYLDSHFKPASQICDVCNVKFDVIGKMETFKTDVFHIISTVNASNRFVFKDFKLEATIDSILDVTGKTFQYREYLERYMPFHDILRRIWRRFKIANILDLKEQFPFSELESRTVTMENFADMVVTLHKTSSKRNRGSRTAAYIQAYRQLTESSLDKLRTLFNLDFELFGYDITGPHLDALESELKDRSALDYDYYDILSG
ncbi:carbohydrate sulfotransferase 13-like [Haliotis rufescens]|uniref:carbohydrate sulfotransferase 13-like n=1 Tax=Haliotis rufescens TaxID=6454 RepID=UPI00201F0671|nr:carbohydrate sulfotransferase 13-like [Haliotis rufescens]XP_048257873.1 carbohydrate sulfotransferase 13-like [Haliotis rufescens]